MLNFFSLFTITTLFPICQFLHLLPTAVHGTPPYLRLRTFFFSQSLRRNSQNAERAPHASKKSTGSSQLSWCTRVSRAHLEAAEQSKEGKSWHRSVWHRFKGNPVPCARNQGSFLDAGTPKKKNGKKRGGGIRESSDRCSPVLLPTFMAPNSAKIVAGYLPSHLHARSKCINKLTSKAIAYSVVCFLLDAICCRMVFME